MSELYCGQWFGGITSAPAGTAVRLIPVTAAMTDGREYVTVRCTAVASYIQFGSSNAHNKFRPGTALYTLPTIVKFKELYFGGASGADVHWQALPVRNQP